MNREAISLRLLQVVAGLLAALVVGLALFWHPDPPERAIPAARGAQGGDFTLQGADGPLRLADYRGKAVLVYFGYTYCPDICPTALTAIADGLRRLAPEEAAKAAAIFISVDPERDTPAHLKEYTAFFHPAITGVTGSPEKIAEVARAYGVFYAKQNASVADGSYAVDHTSDIFLVAPDGKLAGRLPHGTPPEKLAEAMRRLLQSPTNP